MSPRALLLSLALLTCHSALSAQWLTHPTPGIPRLADGKPNLKAATPRTADGRPDLSGIWYLHFEGCGRFGCADYQAGPEFFDFGATLPGGLPYLPWAAALVKERQAANAKDDPIGLCRPGGLFRFHTFPPPRKMVQLPNLVLILSERDVMYRQIFVDGRALPADPEPTWNGYSVGRWEGDTLVVQTNGLREGTWIDRNGSPLTAAATVTERFRRPDVGHLQIEITVTDLKAYARPWTVTLAQELAVDTELLDYHCMDNEKFAGRPVAH
ncbi:MAG TPA: hypothetical protein VFD69_04335 [Vicinamibacterales bacterium]|nr:hypothetical protein [Vicinamibacterales bacterium]